MVPLEDASHHACTKKLKCLIWVPMQQLGISQLQHKVKVSLLILYYRIQRSMNKIWHNNLNQRKQAFWNMLKNKNTRVIYVDWFYRDNFPASQRSKKKNKRGTFIGKDEGTSQTSPCGSRTQQGKIQRKG